MEWLPTLILCPHSLIHTRLTAPGRVLPRIAKGTKRRQRRNTTEWSVGMVFARGCSVECWLVRARMAVVMVGVWTQSGTQASSQEAGHRDKTRLRVH
jgi:3,4-dihydroxy-2-butanone 4-phosphate synthase